MANHEPNEASRPACGLVAVDLDGTLLTSGRTISAENTRAVIRARRAGIRVVLTSARPPRGMTHVRRALGLTTLLIGQNGALVHDPDRRRPVLCHQPLPADAARAVVRSARSVSREFVVSLEVIDRWYTDAEDLAALPHELAAQFEPDQVGPLEAFLRVPATKLMVYGPPERIAELRERLKRRFPGVKCLSSLTGRTLTIMHRGTEKAKALAWVARHYGVDRRRVAAVGDEANDIGMIRWAGLGVAMGNASDSVRAAADRVTAGNDGDGVAGMLRWAIEG